LQVSASIGNQSCWILSTILLKTVDVTKHAYETVHLYLKYIIAVCSYFWSIEVLWIYSRPSEQW